MGTFYYVIVCYDITEQQMDSGKLIGPFATRDERETAINTDLASRSLTESHQHQKLSTTLRLRINETGLLVTEGSTLSAFTHGNL